MTGKVPTAAKLFMLIVFSFGINFTSVADTLAIGIKDSPPFIILKENETPEGLCIDIWKKISDSISQPEKFVKYTLQDLLISLENGESDLSIVPLTVTPERMRRLYFSQPFYITTLSIATLNSPDQKLFSIIRNFFSLDFFKIILLLFLVILFFGWIVWLFERRYNHQQFRKGIPGVFDGIWWAAVTMTTVGYGDKSPVSFWGRFFSIIWMFSAVIIISSFTATISSTLTVNRIQYSIEKLSDLHDVRVGTVSESSVAEFLESNGIETNHYMGVEDGLEALKTGKIKAFVYDQAILDYYFSKPENQELFKGISIGANKEYFSFASKDPAIINKINPLLIEVIESPEWPKMLRKYGLNVD
jgi:ABC-type amino acid transport substrate-binding protein